MRTRKSGFTIVEMLMVIGILAVLMGLVTTAATAAIRQSRSRRTEAAKQILQSGISAYYAQHNYWPPKSGQLQSWAENGMNGNDHVDALSASDYDTMMRELAKKSYGSGSAQPVLDFSGMMVATATAATQSRGHGQSFSDAVTKNKKHGSTIKLADMVFGYITKDGYFRRFIVQYNADSDTVTVMTRDDYSSWWSASGQSGSVQWPSGYSNVD